MGIKRIDEDKVRATIDRYLSKAEIIIGIRGPLENVARGIEDSGGFLPLNPMGMNPIEACYAFGKMAELSDKKELEFIVRGAELNTKCAYTFYRFLESLDSEVKGKRRLERWFYTKMYEKAINELYEWLQDDNSRFHQIKNRFAIQSLKFLHEKEIPLDSVVSEQIKRAA